MPQCPSSEPLPRSSRDAPFWHARAVSLGGGEDARARCLHCRRQPGDRATCWQPPRQTTWYIRWRFPRCNMQRRVRPRPFTVAGRGLLQAHDLISMSSTCRAWYRVSHALARLLADESRLIGIRRGGSTEQALAWLRDGSLDCWDGFHTRLRVCDDTRLTVAYIAVTGLRCRCLERCTRST